LGIISSVNRQLGPVPSLNKSRMGHIEQVGNLAD
jgi:hypothetical protein